MRALRGAALLLTALLVPALCSGQAPSAGRAELLDAALADPVSWWSQPGLPGWTPGADFGVRFPATLAGLTRGGWSTMDLRRSTGTSPFPGIPEAGIPLTWLDTLVVASAVNGAEEGFDASFAKAGGETDLPEPRSGHRTNARADVLLAGGSDGYQDNVLSLRTGDPRSFLWGEAESMNRDEHGALGLAGHHAYDAVMGRTRGSHRIVAAFAQRGAAASLPAGADESVSGESGLLEYRWTTYDYQFQARLARGHDGRESFGAGLPFARRDAQENQAVIEFARRDTLERWALQVRASEAEVRRESQGVTDGGTAASLWASGRWQQPTGDGVLSAALGAGRHDGVDRFEWAPSLGYQFGTRPFAGRAVIERQLVPVWSDLAPAQARFLQSTWLGGLELNARAAAAQGRLGFYAGRTRDRAVVARFPLVDLWLRAGFRADPGDYDFALVHGDGRWTIHSVTLGAGGFALSRDAGSLQPRVDPSQGFRAFAEWGFLAFQRDLGVRFRGEAAGIGTRDVQSGALESLPGYVSYGASVVLVLSDVRLTIRAWNLEDRRRPEVWRDLTTGEPAVGSGREFQTSFTWRLFD